MVSVKETCVVNLVRVKPCLFLGNGPALCLVGQGKIENTSTLRNLGSPIVSYYSVENACVGTFMPRAVNQAETFDLELLSSICLPYLATTYRYSINFFFFSTYGFSVNRHGYGSTQWIME